MEKPFVDPHASAQSQLGRVSQPIDDTEEIHSIRALPVNYGNLILLGKALSRSLRYREAVEVYSEALRLQPDSLEALRLRAGRNLSVLELDCAITDFLKALSLGGGELDCRYRLGLAYYYKGDYVKAMEQFAAVLPLADPEMEIALRYWHTLSAFKSGKTHDLSTHSVEKSCVGHHYSYWEAVSFLNGELSAEKLTDLANRETCDMEYSMKMYALHVWNEAQGIRDSILEKILKRDEYWFCFSSLAAWIESR